jgi:hypothetical protein
MREFLEKLLEAERHRVPTNHEDLFGATPDDAYDLGISDGRAELARELYSSIFLIDNK